MSNEGAVVSFLSNGASWAEPAALAMQDAGLDVRYCGVAQDLLVALRDAPVGVLVVADVAGGLTPIGALQVVYDCAAGTIPPVLVLVGPGDAATPAELLRGWGVPALSFDAPPEALLRAVHALATPARSAHLAEARARAVEEEFRAHERRRDLLRSAAGDLHHEVRSLLSVILGNAANLRDDIAKGAREEQSAAAAAIADASLRAAGLLDRFQESVREALEPSDLQAFGTGRGRRTRVDLNELIGGVVALFATEARARGVALSRGRSPAVTAWCERDQIAQVLLNLLSNALKFTPRGGAVTCEARLIPASEADGARAPARAEIVVRDTGPGILLEERERVFERGERGERDRGTPGQGLGLAICRDLVEQHRGAIAAEDAPGGGALLRVSLPVDPRSRLPSGVLFVREPHAVEPFIDALMAAGPEGLAAVEPSQREVFLRAAAACQAVVVIPRGRYGGVFEAVLRREKAAGSSQLLDEAPSAPAGRAPP
jgi:signal transduction histidine kinase